MVRAARLGRVRRRRGAAPGVRPASASGGVANAASMRRSNARGRRADRGRGVASPGSTPRSRSRRRSVVMPASRSTITRHTGTPNSVAVWRSDSPSRSLSATTRRCRGSSIRCKHPATIGSNSAIVRWVGSSPAASTDARIATQAAPPTSSGGDGGRVPGASGSMAGPLRGDRQDSAKAVPRAARFSRPLQTAGKPWFAAVPISPR